MSTRHMKALVKYAPGDGNLDILDVEEPRCGDRQVKVEVAYNTDGIHQMSSL